MTHVLVTGGAGFIGSHLVDRLLEKGHRVTVLDDLSWGNRQHLPEGNDRLAVIVDSVANIEAHTDRLRDVECVFHLAALISAYDSLDSPAPYFETNVNGLLAVLRLCGKLERPRLVFASTSGLYGNNPDATVRTETDLPRPTTVYALTKLAGEHLLEMYRGRLRYDDVSLRLFNVYGPRQSRNHPYANVTCRFSWAAATGAPVILYGDGEQTRDFVYVGDVVRAMLAAGEQPVRRRIYNVGTGQYASIGGLLELVQDVSGRKLEIERRPPWPNDIRAIRADVTALEADLGVRPSVSLREGLAQTIEYFRAQGS